MLVVDLLRAGGRRSTTRVTRRRIASGWRKRNERWRKKREGSANRAKARFKVAKIYGRVADRRRNHLRTLSTRLVRENQLIAVTRLGLRNMLKNRSLSRVISDAAWSEFWPMLIYKAGLYGFVAPWSH